MCDEPTEYDNGTFLAAQMQRRTAVATWRAFSPMLATFEAQL